MTELLHVLMNLNLMRNTLEGFSFWTDDCMLLLTVWFDCITQIFPCGVLIIFFFFTIPPVRAYRATKILICRPVGGGEKRFFAQTSQKPLDEKKQNGGRRRTAVWSLDSEISTYSSVVISEESLNYGVVTHLQHDHITATNLDAFHFWFYEINIKYLDNGEMKGNQWFPPQI